MSNFTLHNCSAFACRRTSAGLIGIGESGGAVSLVAFLSSGAESEARGSSALVDEAFTQLNAWFAGRLWEFSLPLAQPGSDFARRAREAMLAIPYGETASYGELAAAIGSPGAARAVGMACGRNPLPIIVPCHRVVAAGGRIGGYSGGTELKRWLLEFERRNFR